MLKNELTFAPNFVAKMRSTILAGICLLSVAFSLQVSDFLDVPFYGQVTRSGGKSKLEEGSDQSKLLFFSFFFL
jgi:hypothetical protein